MITSELVTLCFLPPLILAFYTCYSYGRLVGYRLAVEDRRKIFEENQERSFENHQMAER